VSNEETPVTEGQPAAVNEVDASSAEKTENTEQDNTVSLAEYQKLQTQSQEYLDGWQRARAEFANYRKRVDRDMKDSYQNAAGDVLKSLLPVIDDFDRALANIPQDLQGNPWLNGVEMIQRKLNKILDDFGVTAIEGIGEAFDPTSQEAIGEDAETDVESGHVSTILQKGYRVGERVLRPAMVRVAR
jgi:molecular chaperone GrpE